MSSNPNGESEGYTRRRPTPNDPTTLAGQQAAIEGHATAAGLEPLPEADAREQLNRLLDERPDLAPLVLALAQSVIKSERRRRSSE